MPYAFEKNIEFTSIKIYNDNDGFIDLIESADYPDAYMSFDSIVLNEDINEPAMSGSLNLTDANNFLDKLSLKPGNQIEISVTFLEPPPGNFDKEPEPIRFSKTLYFNIIDIKTTTDMANQKVTGGYGTPVKVIIRFASKMFNYLNYQLNSYFGKDDFLGTISNENLEDELLEEPLVADDIRTVCEVTTITTDLGTEDDPYLVSSKNVAVRWDWGTENPRSFMTELFKKIREYTQETNPKPLYTHSSYNDVWYRPQNYNYPNFKFAKPPTLVNFLNYVKEYAILYTDDTTIQEPAYVPKKPKVDFMFWETMDSFNFKSISKIVEDWGDASGIPFYLTPDETDMGAIVSLEVLQDLNFMELLSEGVYASEYIRVKPNWGNPYRKMLSSDEEFTKRLIRYSYISDILAANEYEPIIAKSTDTTAIGYGLFRASDTEYVQFPNKNDLSNFTKTDLNFGYYSKHTFNSDKNVWWEYLSTAPYGFTYNGYYDNPGAGENTTLDLSGKIGYTIVRREQEYWQSQFDFCELPGAPLYKILKTIKHRKMEDRKNYHEAKQAKEKWKVYKEKICCERKIPTNFFALLTKAEKIYGGDVDPSQMYTSEDRATGKTFADDAGGIYAYDWVEVEFWPRSDVNSILENGEEIIKFENHELFPFVFVKPRGALEGHGIVEKTYKPVQRSDNDPNYKRQLNNESLNKKSLEGKKYLTKDTRAYNLNEILNTSGLGLQSKESGSILKTILSKCKTLITNPGITIKLKGNDTDCLTSYPKQFSMMPVGHFRIISDCVNKEKWKFGRIVQMNVVPKEIMQTMTKWQDGITSDAAEYNGKSTNIQIDLGSENTVTFEPRTAIKETLKGKDKEQGSYPGLENNPAYPEQSYKLEEYKRFFNQSPYLFVFDVENAHDGLCDGVCPVV